MLAFLISPSGRFARGHWWAKGGLQALGLAGLYFYMMLMPDIEDQRTSLIGPLN